MLLVLINYLRSGFSFPIYKYGLKIEVTHKSLSCKNKNVRKYSLYSNETQIILFLTCHHLKGPRRFLTIPFNTGNSK